MAPPRILGVGHVALDQLWQVDELPRDAGKTPARSYEAVVGGMTANACVAAARLGARVRLASPVGDDDAAARFARHLALEGVDGALLVRVAGAVSSVSAVVVDARGERMIVTRRGDALARAPAFDAGWLDGADALLADPRCPAWAEAALGAARARGIVAVFDGDSAPRDDLRRLAGLAAWAVFSEPGAATYAEGGPAGAIEAALAAGADVAVVTLGEQGLVWRRRGAALLRMAAFPVSPVVDTLAAGDVLHGALAVALAEGSDDHDALRFASTAAAIKCTRAGGVRGAPPRAEVQQRLADWSAGASRA